MARGNLNDLDAFLVVARERSFTKAAGKLGVSQSALSHTIRGLEARLGVRLLTRTTRSVSPTEAGERLLGTLAPRFEEIEAELAAVTELREKPAGTIRITATENATETVLLPSLAPLLREYPDIKVEIIIDYGLTDIVAHRYDAGVRSGEQVAKGMIAVRIGPDMRMAVVGAPSYFRKHQEPKAPQDLIGHNCMNLRLPSHGGAVSRPGPSQARARGLVPSLLGLPPLLPKPTPVLGGFRSGRRCAAFQRIPEQSARGWESQTPLRAAHGVGKPRSSVNNSCALSTPLRAYRPTETSRSRSSGGEAAAKAEDIRMSFSTERHSAAM